MICLRTALTKGIQMRKRLFFLTPLSMGLLLVTYVTTQPRFETYHGPDVVMLVTSGALFVVGVAGLFGRIKRPGE